MIQQKVVIKSNKYGITLCLDKDIAFRDLLSQIAEKFKASAKFFGDAQMALSFEGRRLSESEQLEVVQTIQENTSLEILCIMEQDTLTEAYMKEILEDRKKELSASDGKFYKGTLRSGQSLESDASVVVVGDVNPGASVCAKGNVVVLGCAKGYLSAGCDGDDHAFVAALDMQPMQIRIGKHIARSADGEPEKKKKLFGRSKNNDNQPMEAQIAFVEDENIYIEPISKALLNEIIV